MKSKIFGLSLVAVLVGAASPGSAQVGTLIPGGQLKKGTLSGELRAVHSASVSPGSNYQLSDAPPPGIVNVVRQICFAGVSDFVGTGTAGVYGSDGSFFLGIYGGNPGEQGCINYDPGLPEFFPLYCFQDAAAAGPLRCTVSIIRTKQ